MPMGYYQQWVDLKDIEDYSSKKAHAVNVVGKNGTTTSVRANPSNIKDIVEYGGTLDEYQDKVRKEEIQRSRARVTVVNVDGGLRVTIS